MNASEELKKVAEHMLGIKRPDKRQDKQLMALAEILKQARAAYQQAQRAEHEANRTKCLLFGVLSEIEDRMVERHDQLDYPPRKADELATQETVRDESEKKGA